MLEHIREIDTTKWSEEKENNIAQYKNVPGVWILVGKEQANTPLVCLQVAQTKDIGREVARDISYLKTEASHSAPKEYVNQFGECMFSYENYPSRTEILYKKMAEKYRHFALICVAHGEKLKDDRLRKNIEKYVAYKTLCPYWVNGGQYKKKDDEEVKSIKEACKEECDTLFEKIKSDYQEKANSLNQFLDDFINGEIEILAW